MSNEMNKREIAVQLSGVKKMYRLGQIGGGTLQGDLQSWWARIRGKEDPNTMIGTDQRLLGQTFMALNGIDLTIYKGEALGIIGGNGAGKSTMLKLLSRVTAPTAGEIDIYGRIASMLEVGTGFNGEMTGRENVYMNGAILGMTKAEIDAKMDDIIEFSEVRDFIDTPVKRYSSGMYVKLAFSVAAHLDSEIMIMDEVLAVGDMAFQKKCLNKMRDAAQKEGRTVLYVSHNMSTIRQLCDRCIVLQQGKIIYDGDVEKAISVYMDSNRCNEVSIDYSQVGRPDWLIVQRVKLMKAQWAGKDTNHFYAHEPADLEMDWQAVEDVKHVNLRLEIYSSSDVSVGTFFANDICSVKAGEKIHTIMRLDLKTMVPAAYAIRFVFFERDEYGNNAIIDYVDDMGFEIDRVPGTDALVWDTFKWGHIHLPDGEIVENQITSGDSSC